MLSDCSMAPAGAYAGIVAGRRHGCFSGDETSWMEVSRGRRIGWRATGLALGTVFAATVIALGARNMRGHRTAAATLPYPAALLASHGDGVVGVIVDTCTDVHLGSGAVVAEDLVATAAHVVDGAVVVTVVGRDERVFRDLAVVAYAPALDLALVRIPPHSFASLGLADAAVGSTGVVLASRASRLDSRAYRVASRNVAEVPDVGTANWSARDVLTLEAALDPGHSGGPLLDREGRVAGLAFGIDTARAGIAYATPASVVAELVLATAQHTAPRFVAPDCAAASALPTVIAPK